MTKITEGFKSAPDATGVDLAYVTTPDALFKIPAVVIADHLGHLIGSRDDYLVWFPPQTNANAREVAEIFNADAAAIVRVQGLWLMPTFTSITGAQIAFDVNRISAVGTTGSTVVTPRKLDTSYAALDADITARYGSTAGATLDHLYFTQYTFNEETNAGFAIVPWFNMLPQFGPKTADIVLRQNEGVQIKQSVSMTSGLTGALAYFTVE